MSSGLVREVIWLSFLKDHTFQVFKSIFINDHVSIKSIAISSKSPLKIYTNKNNRDKICLPNVSAHIRVLPPNMYKY